MNLLTFIEPFYLVSIKMVSILMMSAKLTFPGVLEVMTS